MSRTPRGHQPAGTYHVTTRTAGPIPMFHDDLDRTHFVNLALRTVIKQEWRCRSFCLMPTHYHLLLDVPANSLKTGMKSLNWRYAWWYNRRHARVGHFVGERYGAVLVATDAHMLNAMRYIALNPVVAGHCLRPEQWLWSSFRRCIGLDDPFPWVDTAPLVAYFGDGDEAMTNLQRFVGTGRRNR